MHAFVVCLLSVKSLPRFSSWISLFAEKSLHDSLIRLLEKTLCMIPFFVYFQSSPCPDWHPGYRGLRELPDEQLRAAVHQRGERAAAVLLQPAHLRLGAGGVQQGGHHWQENQVHQQQATARYVPRGKQFTRSTIIL